jgi:hypothetical protein
MDDQEWHKPAEADPMVIVGSAMMLVAESAAVGRGLGGRGGRSWRAWRRSLRPWNRVQRPWAADLAEAVWPGLDPDLSVEPGGPEKQATTAELL